MVNAKSIIKGKRRPAVASATIGAASTASRASSARTGSRGSGGSASVKNTAKITAWKSNRDVVVRGRCHHLRPFPPNLLQTSGNALLRRLVTSQQLAYNGTTSKARKSEIVQAIFDTIVLQQGRFLQLESLPPTPPTPTANATKTKQRTSRRSNSAKLPFQFTVMDRDAAMNRIRQALREVKVKAGSIVTTPYSPHDVLLGSSGLESCLYADYTDHPGNAHFWRVVQEHCNEYSAAVAHGNAMLQDEIVKHVISKQRGRFLQRIKASSLTKAEMWVRMDSGSIATMVQFALRSRPTTTTSMPSKHVKGSKHVATAATAPCRTATATATTTAAATDHLKLIGQVDKFDIFRVVLSATAAFHSLLQHGLGMSVVETNGLSADRLALFPRFATSCAFVNDVGYGSLAQQMGLMRHDVLCWVEYTGGMISSHTAGQPLIQLFGGQAVIQLWSRPMFEEHCRRWRKGNDFYFYIVRQRRMPMQQSPCMPFGRAILGFPPVRSRPTERSLVVDAPIAELHGNGMA